jgi:hypothetical protein
MKIDNNNQTGHAAFYAPTTDMGASQAAPGNQAITIDAIAGDDVIGIDQATDLVTLGGKLNPPRGAMDLGVSVGIDGISYGTVVNRLVNTWSVQVMGSLLATAVTTTVIATLLVQDDAGNTVGINALRNYRVDTIATDH